MHSKKKKEKKTKTKNAREVGVSTDAHGQFDEWTFNMKIIYYVIFDSLSDGTGLMVMAFHFGLKNEGVASWVPWWSLGSVAYSPNFNTKESNKDQRQQY